MPDTLSNADLAAELKRFNDQKNRESSFLDMMPTAVGGAVGWYGGEHAARSLGKRFHPRGNSHLLNIAGILLGTLGGSTLGYGLQKASQAKHPNRPLDDKYWYLGLPISIETAEGSTRSGTDKDGHEWSNVMKCDYGYIRGTESNDGEHLDVFVGDDDQAPNVYVIRQIHPGTSKFDEDKVMVGFSSKQEAWDMYKSNYDRLDHVEGMRELPLDAFKAMLKQHKGKRLTIDDRYLEKMSGAKFMGQQLTPPKDVSVTSPKMTTKPNGTQPTVTKTTTPQLSIPSAQRPKSSKVVISSVQEKRAEEESTLESTVRNIGAAGAGLGAGYLTAEGYPTMPIRKGISSRMTKAFEGSFPALMDYNPPLVYPHENLINFAAKHLPLGVDVYPMEGLENAGYHAYAPRVSGILVDPVHGRGPGIQHELGHFLSATRGNALERLLHREVMLSKGHWPALLGVGVGAVANPDSAAATYVAPALGAVAAAQMVGREMAANKMLDKALEGRIGTPEQRASLAELHRPITGSLEEGSALARKLRRKGLLVYGLAGLGLIGAPIIARLLRKSLPAIGKEEVVEEKVAFRRGKPVKGGLGRMGSLKRGPTPSATPESKVASAEATRLLFGVYETEGDVLQKAAANILLKLSAGVKGGMPKMTPVKRSDSGTPPAISNKPGSLNLPGMRGSSKLERLPDMTL